MRRRAKLVCNRPAYRSDDDPQPLRDTIVEAVKARLWMLYRFFMLDTQSDDDDGVWPVDERDPVQSNALGWMIAAGAVLLAVLLIGAHWHPASL